MTTPTKAQRNLLLAKWLYPHEDWESDTAGIAIYRYYGGAGYFDISESRCRTAVMVKLSQSHNITIHERKRSGRTVWEAVTRDGGSTEHESLEILLWQVVEKILEGGK